MRIGVPKETKTLEGRVALVPAAAGDLVSRGHEVWIEAGAADVASVSRRRVLAGSGSIFAAYDR